MMGFGIWHWSCSGDSSCTGCTMMTLNSTIWAGLSPSACSDLLFLFLFLFWYCIVFERNIYNITSSFIAKKHIVIFWLKCVPYLITLCTMRLDHQYIYMYSKNIDKKILTTLCSTFNVIGKDWVTNTSKEEHNLHVSLIITFIFEFRFWNLKWQYLWFASANQMRQFTSQFKGQVRLWKLELRTWKCPQITIGGHTLVSNLDRSFNHLISDEINTWEIISMHFKL